MKAQKFILTFLLLCASVLALYASCYSEWNDAYNSASEELACDIIKCEGASWPSRCNYEANMDYNLKVETAGQEYYNCLNRR
ncbi:hypothetical protein [Flavilitoribacter nigricans]|uniref:Lipoprotein n=1 Tax=Flavilitoribacter nigricans (strain ATCC 23147 / DSM 23189 / NBRC 102662 / NCIMB 1420 / SS-2) TaxID=1122177 RepID=A0A2D0N7C2_FLAN2|nr:hypothetical protein [Flavilitoribacter nigricans]PHN03663.1 hypothetical protein CRP01_25775 [Flavilitoribacter nigricans DSM 23189 = NBRC 102662]